jgi:hypothetical protein
MSVTPGIAPVTTLLNAARAVGRSSQIEMRCTATQVETGLNRFVTGSPIHDWNCTLPNTPAHQSE